MTITNSGNAPITFTGFTGSGGTGSAGFSASPLTGAVPANGSLPVTIAFSPAIVQFYSNVLSVTGDQTSGNNAINVSGFGINNLPLFTMSGVGNTVFTMPDSVQKLHVTASLATSGSNFIVWVGPASSACSVSSGSGCRLLVNTLIGPLFSAPTYDSGTIQTGGGGTVSVSNSDGVSWAMTEVR